MKRLRRLGVWVRKFAKTKTATSLAETKEAIEVLLDEYDQGPVYAGVIQVNVRVPTAIVPGNLVELLLTVGNSTSLEGVMLPAVTLSVR